MKQIKQKKLLIVVLILLFVAIRLIIRYSTNNTYIKKYNNKEYDLNIVKKLLNLNIQERYIAHFNYGTALYQLEQYEQAKEEFNEALKTVPDKRVCDVRVNITLTELKLFKEEEDLDIYIKKIENIQGIVLQDSCATKDQKGRDQKAQEIYDYLEKLKEQLQQQQGGGGGQEDPNQGDDPGQEQPTQVIDDEDNKINQIQQQNQNAAGERDPSKEREYNSTGYKEQVW